ncbi:hypothetical protein F2Q69_00009537 [Brassica cretica]|uniref:Uncharacterized protein n=1 Tax=Brassica cretica TaxID=69181 RepID=A0A8S9P007_BRACR|nr:hypothetical protein F2Q69_00009537 [Brassica cretica]
MRLTSCWLRNQLGRYVATELWFELGRYVATELWLKPGRYVVTELWLELGRYVATELLARARSLRSDRAEHVFGCCVVTLFELLSDDSCFFRKALRKEESISKKYLSKKVSTFSSSGILTLTSLQPFSTPTQSYRCGLQNLG